MMNKPQLAQWKKYCMTEQDCIRRVYLSELDNFIKSLEKSDPKDYQDWVFSLSRGVIDEKNGFPNRMPLFEAIIFPVLHEGFNNRQSGCARWLAGFCQLVYKSAVARSVLGENISEVYFLRTALQHDSDDVLAKKQLVKSMAWQLDFAIHEVPSGVLWGNCGATIEQCNALTDELNDFTQLVTEINQIKRYQELIKECAFHFREYTRDLCSNHTNLMLISKMLKYPYLRKNMMKLCLGKNSINSV